VNFKIAKSYTKSFLRGFLFAFFYFAQVKVSAFEFPVDMSRRAPASVPEAVSEVPAKEPSKSLFATPKKTAEVQPEFSARQNDAELLKALKKAMLPTDPSNEIVILNTETGFIPAKVQLRKGEAYKIHVVNLNMREKNTSFLMDAFTQSHNTVFGVQKTFNIEPQVEGIFSFQCPETGIQGQVVVVQDPADNRKPASTGSEH
jgi:FtsP/CotA-like multicopper oxidase with cupredoxin domain